MRGMMALFEQPEAVVGTLATSLALLGLLLVGVCCRSRRRADNFRVSLDRRELEVQLLEHRYKQKAHPQSDESQVGRPPSESPPNSIPPAPPSSIGSGRSGSNGGGAESDAGSSRGKRDRGSSRACSEVASDAGAASLLDEVQYAVTGPAVVGALARSFVVQVWAMIAAKMALFKDSLLDEVRYTHTLDELERAVTDFEVTVLVRGCIVNPETQCMQWNRKMKSVYHEVIIPQQLTDNQLDCLVIIRQTPSSSQRPILFKAPFKIPRAQSMQPLTGSSVLQGSDVILQRLNLVEQMLCKHHEQIATNSSAIVSARATAGHASCTAHRAAAAAQALHRKVGGVHPDLVEGVKRASVRIGLLDRAKCRLLELGSGTIIDAGVGAPRNQVLTVAHLFVDPVENTKAGAPNPHYLEPIWTKDGHPAAIDWTSGAAPLILAIGMWEADDQPSRWMWWAELVTPLATLQEKSQSPHAPHSMTHMLDLAVIRICGRLELTPDVFQGFGMNYSVVAKYPAMASLAEASSPLPPGLELGYPEALQVSADMITVFGWFSPLGEVTLFAPQAATLAAKSHGLLQASVVLHSGGSGGAAVDNLGRVVAVNWRSGLPELPPRRNYMAYMRMVSWLLPQHGLVFPAMPAMPGSALNPSGHAPGAALDRENHAPMQLEQAPMQHEQSPMQLEHAPAVQFEPGSLTQLDAESLVAWSESPVVE